MSEEPTQSQDPLTTPGNMFDWEQHGDLQEVPDSAQNPAESALPLAEQVPDDATGPTTQEAVKPGRVERLRHNIGKITARKAVALLAVAGSSIAGVSALTLMNNEGAPERPVPATAAPATPEPIEASETLEPTAPAATSEPETQETPEVTPDTAVVPKAATPETTNPTPAAEADQKLEQLGEEEIEKIIKATSPGQDEFGNDKPGFEGLRGHRFEVAKRVITKEANYTFLLLDGAEPALPLEQMESNLRIAEEIAAKRQVHTIPLIFGPGQEPTDVTFVARPSHLDQSAEKDNRYIIVTNKNPRELAAPVPAFDRGFTVTNDYGPDVTILQNQPGQSIDALPADDFIGAVEAFQLTTGYDLEGDFAAWFEAYYAQEGSDTSYLQSPYYPEDTLENKRASLLHLVREVGANFEGFARTAAQQGWTYDQYQLTAGETPFRIAYDTPSPTGAKLKVIGPDEYAKLRAEI